MFIIINGSCIEDLSIVMNEDGIPVVFYTEKEAEEYAEQELNFNWVIVKW